MTEFDDVDLRGARFRNVDLTGATMRGVELVDVDIDGLVVNVRINGVEVGALVEAELDRRHPERALLHPVTADMCREAWAMIERSWTPTVERARRLPPDLVHERVDGEWSFVETLRHLVFATDAWVTRAILGVPAPWSPLGLPHDQMPDLPGVPRDREARPSLDEVLALRADRMTTVRTMLDGLDDETFAGATTPVDAPGYPEPKSYAVRRCIEAVLSEEWLHRQFAERDLDMLEATATS